VFCGKQAWEYFVYFVYSIYLSNLFIQFIYPIYLSNLKTGIKFKDNNIRYSMVFFPWEHVKWYTRTTCNDATGVYGMNLMSEDDKWKIEMNSDQLYLNSLREKITVYDDNNAGMNNSNNSISPIEFALPISPVITTISPVANSGAGLHKNQHQAPVGNTWEYYKKIVNPYELVYTQNKYDQFPDSVALIHPLSRSYFKMIEILRVADFFKSFSGKRIRSGHVCEGPGGFIEAFIDECNKNHIGTINSVAMTLKSTQNSIPGWKKANMFLKKYNKIIKILYGKDDTGNILNIDNANSFINYVRGGSGSGLVNIFTGDGGFDFSMNYDIHERLVYPLIESSTVIGMNVLAPGGMMILKFFDIYTEPMKKILFYLSKNFNRWTLYKPATSRPCNSEMYFIGQDRVSSSHLIPPTKDNMEQELSADFRKLLDDRIHDIVLYQIQYLEKVFDLIKELEENQGNRAGDGTDIVKEILERHLVYSFIWCIRFNIPVDIRRFHLIEASQIYQQAVCRQQ
jgi:23S rRNA U2552 (ribose-2'-O)-methylase RlmE/FtsJ